MKKIALLLITTIFLFTACSEKMIQEKDEISSLRKKNINEDYSSGTIKLKDGTVLAYNKPFYKLVILTSIPKKDFLGLKKDLIEFVNLDEKKLIKYREMNKKEVTFSYTITKEQLSKINEIASKYKSVKTSKTLYTEFLDYKRVYPKVEFLQPYLGYVRESKKNETFRINGIKGIESFYHKSLLNKEDLVLNIDLKNQITLEEEVDRLKKKLDVYEVSSVVIDLDSGYVDSIASSNRFNPMSINANQIPYLNSSVIDNPFKIDFFYKPFETVIEKNKIDDNRFLNLKKNLLDLGLTNKSKIDINYERKNHTQAKDLLSGKFEVNFIQLIKAYSSFYNNGVIKDFKIAKQNKISQKQAIPKELANEMKDSLKEYYKSIKNKKVVLTFKDHKKTASIKFKYFEQNSKKLLKGYFIIDKKEQIKLKVLESKPQLYKRLLCDKKDSNMFYYIKLEDNWSDKKIDSQINSFINKNGLINCQDNTVVEIHCKSKNNKRLSTYLNIDSKWSKNAIDEVLVNWAEKRQFKECSYNKKEIYVKKKPRKNDIKKYRCFVNYKNEKIEGKNFFNKVDKVTIFNSKKNLSGKNIYLKYKGEILYHQMCKEIIDYE